MSEQEIEEIKESICDNYCKFPDMYLSEYADPDEANTAMMNEECEYCPLGALNFENRTN